MAVCGGTDTRRRLVHPFSGRGLDEAGLVGQHQTWTRLGAGTSWKRSRRTVGPHGGLGDEQARPRSRCWTCHGPAMETSPLSRSGQRGEICRGTAAALDRGTAAHGRIAQQAARNPRRDERGPGRGRPMARRARHGAILGRKLRHGPQRAKDNVQSKVVSKQHRGPEAPAAGSAGRPRLAVRARMPDVHQRDVRPVPRASSPASSPVASLPTTVGSVLGFEDHPEAAAQTADECRQQDRDAHQGLTRVAFIRVAS